MPGEWVHLDVDRIEHLTDRAMLVLVDGEEVWLPLAVIGDWGQYEVGDEDVTLSVRERFAREKGLA